MKKVSECVASVWRMSSPVRWRLAVSVAAGIVRIAASLSFVWASKHLVDIATGQSASPIREGIAIFAGILLLQVVTIVFTRWWESYTLVKTQNALRLSLFGHVMKSRWDGRERFLSGDTVNRLEEDIRVVADLISSRIPGVLVILFQLAAASAYLVMLSPNLYWVLIVLMVTTVFGSRMFFRVLRRLMAHIRARESELQQVMQESLQHRVLVLTLTSTERVLEKFGWLQDDIADTTRRRLNYNAVARGIMAFGFQAGHAAAFLWGVFGIIAGTVTYGMMTAFLQLVGQVQRPISDVAQQIPAFINALTSIERLMELEELELEPVSAPVILEEAPDIVISNVSYTYPGGDTPVIDNLSCVFPAGAVSLIAGHTGIGKSTLIRLVMGLLKPSSGSITLDGETAGSALRDNFLYVPQGNSLLSGTVRSNLQLACPSATDEQIRQALETASASFVYSLPAGLDAPCGEVGSGLSEGQAQRIAIARALLHPGTVMVLDECTSALDAETESRVMDSIHSLYHGKKTILVISHREATRAYADNVVNLD